MMNNMNDNANGGKNIILPQDMIVEILLRLPVRSLVHFKCVCTSWLWLISQEEFAKSHYDLDASPTHRVLLHLDKPRNQITSLDLESLLDDKSSVVNLTYQPYSHGYQLNLGSCIGFILMTNRTAVTPGDIVLWNPKTDSHKVFKKTYAWDSWYDPSHIAGQGIPPYASTLLQDFMYGFGYDHSTDDYLLVLVRWSGWFPKKEDPPRPAIEVFSVKTNVPSFIFCDVDYPRYGHEYTAGMFINGSLHWLATFPKTFHLVIVAFDLVARTLSEISVPSGVLDSGMSQVFLRVLGGCLCLCFRNTYYTDEELEDVVIIWAMKDYKVDSSWTRSGFMFPRSELSCFPIWLTEDGGIVASNPEGIDKYDDEGHISEYRPNFSMESKGSMKYFDLYRESLLTRPHEPQITNREGSSQPVVPL